MGKSSLKITGPDAEGRYIAKIKTAGGTDLEVRQIWKQGDLWWREYERYKDGKLELRAKFVPKMVAVAPPKQPPMPSPPPPPDAKAAAKAIPPKFIDDTNEPLRADPRLQAAVSAEMRNPRIENIIDYLQKATNLKFTVAENVDKGRVVYGTVSYIRTPAWDVMRGLAESPSLPGRWEKTDAGFRFVAASSVQAAAVEHSLVASDTPDKPNVPSATGDSWGFRLALIAFGAVSAWLIMTFGRPILAKQMAKLEQQRTRLTHRK